MSGKRDNQDLICNPADEEVIRCEQLTKRYGGDILAVDHLDLTIHRGEIFGLLGPNGAGKTTTVGMLTTLVVPTAGKAIVDGIDVVARPALVKQIIGVVAQTNNLDRALSVWENLYYHGLFFGMSAGESRAVADELLNRFHLSDRAKASVMTLSGGMSERLMVARALMHRPSVLFLDEPTAGLDPQSRIALWEILNGLHEEGQTILLTTHYLEEADLVCDRLAIIDHGRLLAVDTPANMKKSVDADSIVTIMASGDLDRLAKVLREKVAGATGAQRVGDTILLHVKESAGVLPRVIFAAEQEGFSISDLSISEPTLQSVFIKLTGKELRE